MDNINLLNKYVKEDTDALFSSSSSIFDIVNIVSKKYYENISLPSIKIKPLRDIYIPNSKNKSIRLTLDFFKSIDDEMYQNALKILSGQSEIPIHFHQCDPVTISHRRSRNNYLSRSIGLPHKQRQNIDKTFTSIDVYLSNSIEDVFNLSHELSHTFTVDTNKSLINHPKDLELLSEVIPFSIEQLLQNYLLKEKVITKTYANQSNILRTIDISDSAFYIQLRLFLIGLYKDNNDKITFNTLKNNSFIRNEEQIQSLCQYYEGSDSILRASRYVIADTIAIPNIVKKYNSNPDKTISQLKDFSYKLESGQPLNEILSTIDIGLSTECLYSLLDKKNEYNKNLLKNYQNNNSNITR